MSSLSIAITQLFVNVVSAILFQTNMIPWPHQKIINQIEIVNNIKLNGLVSWLASLGLFLIMIG